MPVLWKEGAACRTLEWPSSRLVVRHYYLVETGCTSPDDRELCFFAISRSGGDARA